MNKKMTFSLFGGLIVSAVALYFALRHVPILELWAYLQAIDYRWVVLSGGMAVSCFVLRAYRWKIILTGPKPIGFFQAFHPLMIGFMINCILPGRIGEAARPFILKQKNNYPFATGLATVVAERVMDACFLLALLSFVMSVVDISPDFTITFGSYELNASMLSAVGNRLLFLSLTMIAVVFLIFLPLTRSWIKLGILSIPALLFFASDALKYRIKKILTNHVTALIDLFAEGFSLLENPKKMFSCLVLTILIWSTTAFSYYVMAMGCPGIELSYLEMSAVMVMVCLFIALPSVPGFWGIWEAGGVFALCLFGVSAKAAAGFTLTSHAVQIFPVIVIGLISTLVMSIDIFQFSKSSNES